jgi:hypothetical protein
MLGEVIAPIQVGLQGYLGGGDTLKMNCTGKLGRNVQEWTEEPDWAGTGSMPNILRPGSQRSVSESCAAFVKFLLSILFLFDAVVSRIVFLTSLSL